MLCRYTVISDTHPQLIKKQEKKIESTTFNFVSLMLNIYVNFILNSIINMKQYEKPKQLYPLNCLMYSHKVAFTNWTLHRSLTVNHHLDLMLYNIYHHLYSTITLISQYSMILFTKYQNKCINSFKKMYTSKGIFIHIKY